MIVIKVKFNVKVSRQVYDNGLKLFKDENINKVRVRYAYFEKGFDYLKVINSWNRNKPWEYECLSSEVVPAENNIFIHTDSYNGYRYNSKNDF